MYQIPEQLLALNKANREAAMRFAGIALKGTERMLEAQLKTAKSAFADGVQQAKMLAAAKDPEDLAQLTNTLTQPNLENATSYVASLYDIATSTQSEINILVEEQIAEFNNRVVAAFDQLTKYAPAGSEAACAAVKSALTVANLACDNVAKSAKQFGEMVKANGKGATGQAMHEARRKAA